MSLTAKDFNIGWNLDGIHSPVFDACFVVTQAGPVAANTAILTVPNAAGFPLRGLQQVEVCCVIETTGSQGIYALNIIRLGGSVEIVELFCASAFNPDRNTFLLECPAGTRLTVTTVNALVVGDIARICLRHKYLGR